MRINWISIAGLVVGLTLAVDGKGAWVNSTRANARHKSFDEVETIVQRGADASINQVNRVLGIQRENMARQIEEYNKRQDEIIRPALSDWQEDIDKVGKLPGEVCPKEINAIIPKVSETAQNCQKAAENLGKEFLRFNAILYTLVGRMYQVVEECLTVDRDASVACATQKMSDLSDDFTTKLQTINVTFEKLMPVVMKDFEKCLKNIREYGSNEVKRLSKVCQEIRMDGLFEQLQKALYSNQ